MRCTKALKAQNELLKSFSVAPTPNKCDFYSRGCSLVVHRMAPRLKSFSVASTPTKCTFLVIKRALVSPPRQYSLVRSACWWFVGAVAFRGSSFRPRCCAVAPFRFVDAVPFVGVVLFRRCGLVSSACVVGSCRWFGA